AITTSPPILPIEDPRDSLIMGNEEINTIPEKESDEFIKSSVEDLIIIPKEKAVTFSNPLFNSNDDFTSSEDESLSDEDVPKDNVKICSNPHFKFDDEYISSDVNPLFDELLKNIASEDSYDSNINDFEDGDYDSEGDILNLESLLNDDLVHHDLSISSISVASILEGFTNEPPLDENDVLFDLEPKNDDWKKICMMLLFL
nr:hypothetical protein [Tanacetum cinerariifolium]